TSGAAELALQGIKFYRTLMSDIPHDESADKVKAVLVQAGRALVKAHPAMAPLFHLANDVLNATRDAKTTPEVMKYADEALTKFETRLCESASRIADYVFKLIPPGELVF